MAVILTACLSDVYAYDVNVLENNLEELEIESTSSKDNVEENKELSGFDVDKEVVTLQFIQFHLFLTLNFHPLQSDAVLIPCFSDVFLPPPETAIS